MGPESGFQEFEVVGGDGERTRVRVAAVSWEWSGGHSGVGDREAAVTHSGTRLTFWALTTMQVP